MLIWRARDILWLTLAYAAAAAFAIAIGRGTDLTLPVWPAGGIALFALLRFGTGLWPGIVLGSLAANFAFAPSQPLSHILIAGVSAAAAVTAAWLFRRINGDRRADTGDMRAVSAMAAACVLLGVVAATLGLPVLAATIDLEMPMAGPAWLRWLFGDIVGAIVVAPLLMVWWPGGAPPTRSLQRVHLAICLAATVALAVPAFTNRASFLLPYHLFLPLMWAALAHRMRGATAAIALMAAAGIVAATAGRSMFTVFQPGPGAVLLTQQFIVVAAVATLLLAAATDERRAESALRASRARLHYALDAARMVAWQVDRRTRRIAHTGDHIAFFGREIGSSDDFYAMVHPDDRELVRRATRAGVDEGQGYDIEYRLLTADGRIKWLHDRGQVSATEPGIVSGVNSDITARKEAELALAEERERLGLAQEATGIGVWELRLAVPRQLYWAPELYRLWNRDPALGPPSKDDFFTMLHPDDAVAAQAAVVDVAVGDLYEAEFRVRGPDGGWRWLATRARAMGAPGQPADRWLGVNVDITDRRRDEERQRLLISELDHRVKNILATIQALIVRSASTKDSVGELATTLQGRVQAMARAHSMLARNRWESASLRSLIADEVRPYGFERVGLTGPDVALLPRAGLSLSLAIHELCTNAAKYGALSVPEGRLDIAWTNSGGRLRIDWRERGGPRIDGPPERRGFGSVLTERVIRHEFGGSVSIDYAPEGLSAMIDMPLERVAHANVAGGEEALAVDAVAPASVAGLRVLVAEDSPLVADALEAQLLAAEASVIGPFATPEAALAALGSGLPDVAVLDINLQGGDAVPVAEALAARQVPFLFASGYGDFSMLPASLRDRPRITKPYTEDGLLAAIAALRSPSA